MIVEASAVVPGYDDDRVFPVFALRDGVDDSRDTPRRPDDRNCRFRDDRRRRRSILPAELFVKIESAGTKPYEFSFPPFTQKTPDSELPRPNVGNQAVALYVVAERSLARKRRARVIQVVEVERRGMMRGEARVCRVKSFLVPCPRNERRLLFLPSRCRDRSGQRPLTSPLLDP